MKTLNKIIIIIAIISVTIAFKIGNDVSSVAKQEFNSKTLLTKYEWFKDAMSQLDKKRTNIVVFQNKINDMKQMYVGVPRIKWAENDRQSYSIWQAELAGIISSYNNLAAEYNSQMSKFNWRFCNAGSLPKGADTPLPKEFRSYITQ